jgi:GNAT superfamily N-acetyltransferase
LIREAGTSDLDALVELNLQVQRLHVDEEPEQFVEPSREAVAAWLSERLGEEGWRALVAEADGRCVGYVLFELIDRPIGTFTAAMRAVYIHQIGVDSGVRRRGIGRALVQAVEREAAALGVQQSHSTRGASTRPPRRSSRAADTRSTTSACGAV